MTAAPTGPQAAALIAGLDPGRSKCGLVLADLTRQRVLQAAILPPASCLDLLRCWQQQGLGRIVLGNGTVSRDWRPVLAGLQLELALVDERGSTLAARDRYWDLFPPGLWLRLLPAGLRLPPRDIDDVVAQLLLERHAQLQLQRESAEVLRNWQESD